MSHCQRCGQEVRRRHRCDICKRLCCVHCLDWTGRNTEGRKGFLWCTYERFSDNNDCKEIGASIADARKKTDKFLVICKPSGFAERSKKAHDKHEQSVGLIETALKEAEVQYDLIRDWSPEEIDGFEYDLIVTVGGDGTLLYVSHYVSSNMPVLAINSAPEDSVGYFCGGIAEDFDDLLDDWRHLNRFEVTRMEVKINGPKGIRTLTKRGLNDALFCHANPAMTTRYDLFPEGPGRPLLHERQMSSGLWFSTAVGSTAAIRSAGGFTMPHDSQNVQWLVREPYQPPGRRLQHVHGFLRTTESIQVESRIQDGRVYVDGSHLTEAVTEGERLIINRSSEPLTLLNFRTPHRRAR